MIVFFAAAGGIVLWAPILHAIARLFGKPWILRAFGGGFDRVYARLPVAIRTCVRRTSLSADLVLFQTSHLVHHFRSILPGNNVFWHANSRPVGPQSLPPSHKVCRRFVFVGHVNPGKGIGDILHASDVLAEGVEIHVFGPLQGGLKEADFRSYDQVVYRGVLPPDEVISTLRGYHALLLPTHYVDEGLPGVILEAYSVGIPVIASRWSAIPEIVDRTSGILVTPGDPLDLGRAMQRLVDDASLYQALSWGAWRKAREFSLQRWTDILVSYCHAAVSRSPSTMPVVCGHDELAGKRTPSRTIAYEGLAAAASDEGWSFVPPQSGGSRTSC
ncbi:MAG: glycosyltransferase family 4 protein [Chloroflexota bacterium]